MIDGATIERLEALADQLERRVAVVPRPQVPRPDGESGALLTRSWLRSLFDGDGATLGRFTLYPVSPLPTIEIRLDGGSPRLYLRDAFLRDENGREWELESIHLTAGGPVVRYYEKPVQQATDYLEESI